MAESTSKKKRSSNWKKSKKAFSRLTRTETFQNLVKSSFAVCDGDNSGEVSKSELYAGILYVHIRLAKSAGPAACFPPTRDVVDELFDASDVDGSGTIDLQEFEQIMMICCAQIFSRMIAYYSLIILAVPIVSSKITALICWIVDTLDDKLFPNFVAAYEKYFAMLPAGVQGALDWDGLLQKVVSFFIFAVVIPYMFGKIDENSKMVAERSTSRKIAKGLGKKKEKTAASHLITAGIEPEPKQQLENVGPGTPKSTRSTRSKPPPPSLPPPPITPPPPPPRDGNHYITRRIPSAGSYTSSTTDWVLKIRHSEITRSKDLVQIYVTQGMSTSQLSSCIQQASEFSNIYNEPLIGLFRESDGVYVPLDHLLRLSESSAEIYQVTRPVGGANAGGVSNNIGTAVFMMGVLCFAGWMSYNYYTDPIFLTSCQASILTMVTSIMSHGDEHLINAPIRNLFRYGPPFLGGWEGASLPEICMQVTRHGDPKFWERNLTDCSRLFQAKEDAFVSWVRPTVLLSAGAFVLLILIMRKKRMKAGERDMFETYRAMQILIHQVNRMMVTQQQYQHYRY